MTGRPGHTVRRVRRAPAGARGLRRRPSATRTVVATFGVIAALAGVEHGIGEVRQGFEAPPGLTFESWPDTRAFEALNGEPAMSVIPNLAVSGILAVAVSLALGAWAVWFAARPRGGQVLLALSGLLLLVGGGFGPPLVGAVLGVAMMLTRRRAARSPDRAPGRVTALVAPLWGWFLAAGVAGFLALVPGTVLLGLRDLDAAGVALVATPLAFAGLALALVAASARDALARAA